MDLPELPPFDRERRHLLVSLYFLVAGAGVTFLFWILINVGAAQAGMSAGSGSVKLTQKTAKLITEHVAVHCGIGFLAGFFRSLRIRIPLVVAAQATVLSTARFSSIGDTVILFTILLMVFGVSWFFLVSPDVDRTK